MTELGLVFLKTCLIGFTVSMILGPIGIMCIQQTLINGFWAGLAVGLGASTADGIFGLMAGLGLTLVTDILLGHQFWFALIGGAFLCYLGIRTLFSKIPHATSKQPTTIQKTHLGRLYGTIVLLTLANPVTILSFSALLTGVHINPQPHHNIFAFGALIFTGFFLGSLAWWIILTGGLTLLKHRISTRVLDTMNFIAGIVITCFGILTLLRALV